MTDSRSLSRPLIILTGDLGSGKTSGLPLLAKLLGSQRPHFIVNEVGAANKFVGAFGVPSARLSLLPGGCICCEKQSELGDLLAVLVEHPQSEFDAIVLESSGLADPAAILRFISLHPKLNHQLKVSSLVYFLDAASGRPPIPLRHQDLTSLAVADVCVLAKTDMIETIDRDAILAAVANVNATVALFEQRRETDIVLARVQGPRVDQVDTSKIVAKPDPSSPADNQTGPSETANHAHVDVLNFDLPFGTSWLALSTWLIALLHQQDTGILRVKAAITNSGGWVSLNGVGHTVFPPDNAEFTHEGNRPDGTLVIIGFGLSEQKISRSLRLLVSGKISPTS
ncbi:CobW family GTP-binding protein [Cryobacterium ruanii]|uniref:GTP-binding protein n=1 Tax=Cryobacterium ruanii TaxID=1259197 RepID=A0A4R9ALA0_9MICO|nr:GTP-binding protein [Cryobacterium ruanii]TFD64248.1 hypothetical protein E3T47_12230 [Cryobacterium ruanii]